ncbi:hypothetical protein CN692_07240 [Bacillus sp. AFS002410]|uniref:hypothetical protein n=1 Tax=Bacillus sp. AFS002410 TaxID=2033481 RepID=UPI000BF092D5|nr:hypothetical protein [Bacillus sp. AFS002410]PEJ59266.1 hypothetical protein CN692_07240 [Bacillus sp. AFS002410]
MNYFLKLNAVSALYGLLVCLFIYSLFSSEQIHDLTGLNSNLIWNILLGVALIFLIVSFIIVPLLTKKWLESRLWSLFSSVIWLPYFVLFIILTGFLFPNNDLNDDNFGAGLILLFFLIFYPVSLFITTFIGTRLKKST